MSIRFYLALLFISLFHISQAQDYNYSTLDNNLIEELENSTSSDFDIYIILEDKVDVLKLDRELTAQRTSQADKSKIIMSTLQEKAESSQAKLLSRLRADQGVVQETVHPYWLANLIFFKANKKVIAELSHDERIEFIGIDGQLQLVESIDEGPAALVIPDGVEVGLDRINARPMWDLGYTGYGRLALVADTGIDPTHNSFAHRYRGNTNGDAESWYRWNQQQESPFQCGDHGTHVLGTVLGLDRATKDTIGVAFDAQWMGSANLCGGGTQSNIGTFEWSVNPDGDINTSEDMADVINNSWWDPSVFGADCNSVYVDVLNALEAMGVVVVFSAGNAGPDPESMTSPHNINVDIVNTFTVAALNGNNDNLPIADFSSRGPSTCGGEGSLLIKPEIAAPGQGVRSAVLENEYGFKSGTSMAAPHVAGAVLLLRQAFPEMGSRDIKLALYYTCVDLGEPGEDNTYGQGIIDVFAAYQYLIDAGNTPTPPASADNDLMAYQIITDRFECNQALSSDFVFFNNSPDTLYTMQIDFSIDNELNEALSAEWNGVVAPYQMDTISLEEIEVPVGNHQIEISISSPNGKVDERMLNNTLSKQVLISANERLETLVIENQTTCEGASSLVKADYQGDGKIQWFDQVVGGNLIGEGTQFTIESNTNNTIYGDILRSRKVGKRATESDVIFTSNQKDEGILFNALFPLRITSFDFYSEQSGNIFIGVENGRRDLIESEIVPTDGSGWQTAEVSIRIPEGFNYRLRYKDGVAEMGYTTTGLDFPYQINNIMTVVGDVDGNANRYNYFFNLEVEYLDLCGRVSVDISSVQTDSLPVALFNEDLSLVDIDQNQAVNFMNTSTNALSFAWDFDDGNTSQEQNPTHTYTEMGVYYPSLLVTNMEGCTDALVRRIEVFSSTATSTDNPYSNDNNFTLAPNPVSDILNFYAEAPIHVSRVEVYTGTGILASSFPIHSKIAFHTIQLDQLSTGLYYVLIHTENGVDTHKVVKM